MGVGLKSRHQRQQLQIFLLGAEKAGSGFRLVDRRTIFQKLAVPDGSERFPGLVHRLNITTAVLILSAAE